MASTSHPTRLAKLIAHYELYKSIVGLPGHVVECGVFKGASLIRFAAFREMLESSHSRKIIGFDAFGEFPPAVDAADREFVRRFEQAAGRGISVAALERALALKGYCGIELHPGDVQNTVPRYVADHPELKIALPHLDVDVFEPTRLCLEQLFSRVVDGGVVVFDDYGTVAGATRAVDEFLQSRVERIAKLPVAHIPAYIRIGGRS